MAKICLSIENGDNKKLRQIAKQNCRSISGQISYWIKQENKIKKSNSPRK